MCQYRKTPLAKDSFGGKLSLPYFQGNRQADLFENLITNAVGLPILMVEVPPLVGIHREPLCLHGVPEKLPEPTCREVPPG